MIAASNLGQVVGRLIYGELAPAPAADASTPRRRKIDRRGQMRELFERLGSVRTRQVREALDVGSDYVQVLLSNWVASGFVVRHGEPGEYVYTQGKG